MSSSIGETRISDLFYFFICSVASVFMLLVLSIFMHNAIARRASADPVIRSNQ